MAKKANTTFEQSALEVLEQALGLLRDAPAAVWSLRLLGDVPFAVGLLFFLTEMMLSPFAPERLAMESLVLAILYIWKSVWQGIFMQRLHDGLVPEEAARDKQSVSIPRMIALQCGLQALGLIVMPLAVLATLPLPWSLAFFRSVAFFAAKGDPEAVRHAREQALLWPKQNWQILGVLSLAGLLLFFNLMIAIVLVPQIGRTFLGIEGDFTRLGLGILNTSTFATGGVFTWLLLDPLLDAVYVVRCFQGASVKNGDDLRARLNQIVAGLAAGVFIVFALVNAAPLPAQALPAQVQDAGNPKQADLDKADLDKAELDKAIDRTIRQPEFAWRAKREQTEEPPGQFASWVRAAWKWITDGVDWLSEKISEWLQVKPTPTEKPSGGNNRVTLQLSMVAVALVIVGLLVAAVMRRRSQRVLRARAVAPLMAQPAEPAVDLNDESVSADQLPETGWRSLAEELSRNGDYRKALRALYLAALNYLNGRDLVSVRRWKSGLDYRRELERRVRAQARVQPELASVFRNNVALFERGWYGGQSVGAAEVEEFLAGLDAMKRYAEPS